MSILTQTKVRKKKPNLIIFTDKTGSEIARLKDRTITKVARILKEAEVNNLTLDQVVNLLIYGPSLDFTPPVPPPTQE